MGKQSRRRQEKRSRRAARRSALQAACTVAGSETNEETKPVTIDVPVFVTMTGRMPYGSPLPLQQTPVPGELGREVRRMMFPTTEQLRARAERDALFFATFETKQIAPGDKVTLSIAFGFLNRARDRRQHVTSISKEQVGEIEWFNAFNFVVGGGECVEVLSVQVAEREQLAGPTSALMFDGRFKDMAMMDTGDPKTFMVTLKNVSDVALESKVRMEGKAMLREGSKL